MPNLVAVLSALAQQTRLDVLTLLTRRAEEGHTSGDLALQTGVSAGNMSTHLGILENAGLVTAHRYGRRIVYRVDGRAIDELVSNLAHRLGIRRRQRPAGVITWRMSYQTKLPRQASADGPLTDGSGYARRSPPHYCFNETAPKVEWTRRWPARRPA